MNRLVRRFSKSEKGFTLVELLIVVALLGILVALIIPNVITFMTSGEVGAGRAERAVLQVAVDGMMADAGVTTWGETSNWDGRTEGVVTVTVNDLVYDALYYIRREVSENSLWDVAADGEVTCVKYDGITDDDFLDRINT